MVNPGLLHLTRSNRTGSNTVCGQPKNGRLVTTAKAAAKKLPKHYPLICEGCFPGWHPPFGEQLKLTDQPTTGQPAKKVRKRTT